jgi:hypothetical protein
MSVSHKSLFLVVTCVLGAGLVTSAVAAGVGAIPSGHYGCLFGGGGSPGYVDIQGGTYRGPTLASSGTFSPYTMAGNSVTWSAGFGEFNVISSEYKGISNDSTHRPWFSVLYHRTSGGGIDQLDCEQE